MAQRFTAERALLRALPERAFEAHTAGVGQEPTGVLAHFPPGARTSGWTWS